MILAKLSPNIQMLHEYFGFRENPFSENHDINAFYLNNSNKRVYRDLLNDIYQRVDLTLLFADWEVGETAFLQQLIDIDPLQVMVMCFHETGRWPGVIDYLCSEMAVATESHGSEGKERLLAKHLTGIHQQGIIPVLIVDNTQDLEDGSLASLLWLSEQRIDGQPLIQVILAAVPPIMARFDFPVLQPYKSSISRQYQLKALTSTEVNDYIHFRLHQVGCARTNLFSGPAVQAITDRSEGIPWLINKLCSSALLLASQEDHQTVDEGIINRASKYCFLNSGSVENNELDGISSINNDSDKVTPNLPHTRRFKDSNTVAKPSNSWPPQLIRFRSVAVTALILLLVGTMILLQSNPEQQLKEKTDASLDVVQSSTINEGTSIKSLPAGQRQKQLPSLAKTTKKHDVLAPNNRSEIVTTSTPEVIQLSVRTSAIADNPLIDRETPIVDLPTRNPILSDANSSQLLPQAGVIQKLTLQNKLVKNPSHAHRLVPEKLSVQNGHSAISKPTKLERREQQAKNRAVARMKLNQSNIEFGVEALMMAADIADDKTLELLLAGGISPDIQEQATRLTALVIAAANGHNHSVQLLLSQKATIDIRSFKGRTALMAAAGNGHTDTVRVLLNNGAKVDINDDAGWTALMFAVDGNYLETAHVLLERSANDSLKNNVGKTALQIAQNRGH